MDYSAGMRCPISRIDSVTKTEVLKSIISENATSGVRDLPNALKVGDIF